MQVCKYVHLSNNFESQSWLPKSIKLGSKYRTAKESSRSVDGSTVPCPSEGLGRKVESAFDQPMKIDTPMFKLGMNWGIGTVGPLETPGNGSTW